MQKVLVAILILVVGVGGFLYYDWHTKAKKQAAEPSIPQYSWRDSGGVRHFTDSPPPAGATDVRQTRGYQYIDPPLVVIIKNKAVDYYQSIKEKLFTPKKKKKRRRN